MMKLIFCTYAMSTFLQLMLTGITRMVVDARVVEFRKNFTVAQMLP